MSLQLPKVPAEITKDDGSMDQWCPKAPRRICDLQFFIYCRGLTFHALYNEL